MTTPPAYHLVNNRTSSPLTLDPKTTNLSLHAVPTPLDESLAFVISAFNGTDSVQVCTSIKFESYCLDVFGEYSTVPALSENKRGASQTWTVVSADNGLVRLGNSYTGKGWYLDVDKDTNATIMSEGESAGQYWKQEAVKPKNSTSKRKGLSTGAKAGISAGCAVLAIAIVSLLLLLHFRRRARRIQARRSARLSTVGGEVREPGVTG